MEGGTEMDGKAMKYEKAAAEIIYFDDSDVIATSGGMGGSGCLHGNSKRCNSGSGISNSCNHKTGFSG